MTFKISTLMKRRKNFIVTKKAGKYTEHPDRKTEEQEQWETSTAILESLRKP